MIVGAVCRGRMNAQEIMAMINISNMCVFDLNRHNRSNHMNKEKTGRQKGGDYFFKVHGGGYDGQMKVQEQIRCAAVGLATDESISPLISKVQEERSSSPLNREVVNMLLAARSRIA
jgi:hypothetical protein